MTMPTQPSKPQADAAAADPAAGSRRGLGAVARQFAGPSGPAGHLVTWLLARGNASFNRWLVREVAKAVPAPATVSRPSGSSASGPVTALAVARSASLPWPASWSPSANPIRLAASPRTCSTPPSLSARTW
jgi:hypothetical protein